MSIEEKLLHLETKSKVQALQIEKLGEALSSTRNILDTMHEALISLNEFQNKTKEQQEKIILALSQVSNDTNFTSLMLYWLCHLMEVTDKVFPQGTTDLILNCTEEAMNPQDSSFYNLFNQLREESRT